jgi:WD40 repeat protein
MLARLSGWVLVLAVALAGGSTATAQKDKDKGKDRKAPTPPKLAEVPGVTQFEYAPDGSFIAMDYHTSFPSQPHRSDATIGVWDTKTGACRVTMEKPLKTLERLAVSPDGKKIAAITIVDKQFRVWDATTGKVLDDQALPEWKNRIMYAPFLKFSADGKLLYTVRDQQLLEITVGGKFRTVGPKLDFAELGHAVIDPDAKRLVVARNVFRKPEAELSVYDLTKEGDPQKVALSGGQVRAMGFSPDGKTLAVSFLPFNKPRFELWDAGTWKMRTAAPAETRKGFDSYTAFAFSPDGKTIAGIPHYEKYTPKIVDFLDADGKLVREVPMQSLKATALAFSPDGKTLTVHLNNNSAMFLDPATGEEKKP